MHVRRRFLAAVLTAVVAVTGVAVLGTAGPAAAAPTAVTGGYIDWGVRQAFREYVTGPIAHGSIALASSVSGVAPVNRAPAVDVPVRTASDATVPGTSTYRFGVLPGGTNDSTARSASVAAGGVVRYTGHGGQLEVTVDNIRVTVEGNSGSLVADVTSKPLPTEVNPAPAAVLYDDVTLASLNLTGITPTTAGGYATYAGIPASLTAAGVPAFAGFYPAGTALDPVTLVLRQAAPAPAPVVGRAVDTGSVRWTFSRQIWGQTSLNQCIQGLDGATIAGTPSDASFADPANGASFPVAGGAYDAATGATELDLDGTVVIGNRSQGNYRIRFADPALTIDAAGNGTLTADVAYSLSPGGAPPATCDLTGRNFVPGGNDVVIATFTGDVAGATELTGAFTPHFAENVYSADPRLTSVLDPSLRGHFSVSNGNPNLSGTPAVEASHRKALQPIRVGFTLVPPVPTTLDLTPATATANVNTQRCMTARITDETTAALPGQSVLFSVAGVNGNQGTGVTDGSGNTQFCYTSTVAGTDTVTATSGSLTDTATISWRVPAPPPQNPLVALINAIVTAVQRLLGLR